MVQGPIFVVCATALGYLAYTHLSASSKGSPKVTQPAVYATQTPNPLLGDLAQGTAGVRIETPDQRRAMDSVVRAAVMPS